MRVLESNKTYFELIGFLGEGLNSCVYTAIRKDSSRTIHQKVALKILKSENGVESWRQEIESIARVDSIHCVKVLDFEWLQGKPSLVLEWVDGLTLTQLYQHSSLSHSALEEIALQVQQGLIDLHNSGLCHGDLNPNNIIISNKGLVKLVDFGFANIYRYKSQGTPEFMAPELKQDLPPDFWSDLYALGALLDHFGFDKTQTLTAHRDQRDLLPGRSEPLAKQTLGSLVTQVQQKIQQSDSGKTQNLSSALKPVSYLKNLRFATAILLSFSLNTADGQRPLAQPCSLQVRTQKWAQVQVDSKAPKYSPASFIIPSCRPVLLTWDGASGKGAKTITFQVGESKILSDKDLRL